MSRTTRQRSAPPAQTDTTVRVNPYTGKVDGNFRFVWAHGIPIPMIKPNAGMGWSGDSEQAPGDDSDSPKLPLNPDSRKAFVGARQPELTRHLHDYSSRSLLDALAQRIKPWLDPKGDGEIAVEADRYELKPLNRPSWHQVVGTLTARSARSTATTPMLRSLTSTELSPALTGRSLESRVVENKLEVGPEPGGSLYSITYYEEVVCPILQPDHKANLRNPFREVLQFLPECPSLQHMIEAVSALHRGEANSSQELYNLGLKQLELECEGLEQSTDASARDIATTNGLLATIFAMFTHKFFTGGGSYVHEIFRYVCRIVEFQGGSQALSLNTQMQPHMACMLYTDLAVSMLARRKSIFPTDYLDVIVKAQNETWSFYHLVGLTTKVVICMSQICALSTLDSESEAYRAHNQTLQRNIRQIVPDDNAGSYDAIGESTKLQQLRITWQNALRIHYHQVYCPEEMNTESMREMAAQIIDYITSLAQSPVRSYFRLPLLLAGSEERGLRRRSHLIEVIQGWARSTGIKSWLNSVQVLECLWSRQQAADGRDWSLYDLLEVDGWLE